MPSSISLFNSFNFAVVPEEAPSGGENVDTFSSFAPSSPTLFIKNWTLEETILFYDIYIHCWHIFNLDDVR